MSETPPNVTAAAGSAPESSVPESFGRYLMQERELRGIRLEQIADQTRIGLGQLRALEQDDALRLPARVFLVGYVRAYAQAIGLNPDEAVLRFEEHWQRTRPPEPVDAGKRERRLRIAAAVAVVAALAGSATWLLLKG